MWSSDLGGGFTHFFDIFTLRAFHPYSDCGSCFSHVFCSEPKPWNLPMRSFIDFHGIFLRCFAQNWVLLPDFNRNKIRNRCSFPRRSVEIYLGYWLAFCKKTQLTTFLSEIYEYLLDRDMEPLFLLTSLLQAQFSFWLNTFSPTNSLVDMWQVYVVLLPTGWWDITM